MNRIKSEPTVESCYPFGQYHHVVFKDEANGRELLAQIAAKGNFKNVVIDSIEPGIEDCFMALMVNG